MKRLIITVISLLVLSGCTSTKTEPVTEIVDEKKNVIVLNGTTATLNNQTIKEYDYVWHIDTDSEDEYYTGNKPESDDIYIAHDIIYYPEVSKESFSIEEYDGEMEWVTHYSSEELSDYLFGTLPVLGAELPTEMMHSEEEAYNNPVLHINKAGEYILEGNWNGQVAIDLGEEAFEDEKAKVTIILDGVNVSCSVAPSIVFYSVYESDYTWEDREEYNNEIDVSDAGATVIINDGTENNFTGANVYRLLKPVYKKEGSTVQKKRYKMDGSFYSYESLLIKGEEKGTGILNITSTTYEGLDSELHMQIDSGNINIVSNDDGINVNEDNVSVFKMNGGRLTIFAGQGEEGDVIDSNGYIVVEGGTLLGTSPSVSDDILDSEKGSEVSDNATVISGGKANADYEGGFMPQGMPGGFDPNNRPEDFGLGGFAGMPMNGQEPPEKPEGQR